MVTLSTEAIILTRKRYREVDKLYSLYTAMYGKLEGLGRGAYKISSKLAGSLEPITGTNVVLVPGRYHYTIAASEVVNPYKNVKNHLEKILLASHVTNLVDRFVKLHQRDTRLYALLKKTLLFIDQAQTTHRAQSNAFWYFAWRLFALLGYEPELSACVICRKKLEPHGNYFSFEAGGVFCPSCGKSRKDALPCSRHAIIFLREIMKQDIERVDSIRVGKAVARELQELTNQYLHSLLAREHPQTD